MVRRGWVTTKSSKSLIFLHIVFTTKYRRRVISKEILETIEESIRMIAIELGVHIEEISGEEDHVHMLAKFPATIAVAHFIKLAKGVSSKNVRNKHWVEVKKSLWGNHLWSPSYCVVSCGGSSVGNR